MRQRLTREWCCRWQLCWCDRDCGAGEGSAICRLQLIWLAHPREVLGCFSSALRNNYNAEFRPHEELLI